jgi:chromosome segregation ATPase
VLKELAAKGVELPDVEMSATVPGTTERTNESLTPGQMMRHEALLLELAEYKAKMKVAKEQRRAIKKMMEPLEEQLEKAQADLKLAEEGYKKTVTDLKSTGAYQGYRTSSSKDWKVLLRLRQPLEILYL